VAFSQKEKDVLLRRMAIDPLFFARFILGDKTQPMNYHIRSETPQFHYEIVNALNKLEKGEKLAVAAPRGHGKSTLINLVYPLHQILFGSERFLLLISESETQSKYNLESIGNEIEYNDKLKTFFGDRKGVVWGKEEKEIIGSFDSKGNPEIICKLLVRGCGQKVRGLKYGAYRPTLTIIDDGEGEANTITTGQRDKFRRWLNAAVIPGSDSARLINIGTIVDEDSYLNRTAGSKAYNRNGGKKANGWNSLFYQAVVQDTQVGEFVASGKEIIEKDGEPRVLWESRRPYIWLKTEKDRLISEGDAAYFYQEYQNIPMDDSFRVFKKTDMQYWSGFYAWEAGQSFLVRNDGGRKERFPVNVFIGVDPASSENVKADYTVIMVVALDSMHNIYVIDYFRGQVTPMDGADRIFELADKYHPKCINIEETGHVMLADYIIRKSKETGRFLNVNPKKAIKTKYYRIKQMQPLFASKAVFMRDEHYELEQELLAFTELGKHKKDTLDALRWATDDIWVPDMEQNEHGEWIEAQGLVGADWQTGELIYA
jgi:predicted phage terminase large subunit-like protein|tara:strand:- start:5216 stop:6841 length:1626 start_codon:yes stop_codon:yes gene_type:complete